MKPNNNPSASDPYKRLVTKLLMHRYPGVRWWWVDTVLYGNVRAVVEEEQVGVLVSLTLFNLLTAQTDTIDPLITNAAGQLCRHLAIPFDPEVPGDAWAQVKGCLSPRRAGEGSLCGR